MLPKVANHILHHTARAAAAVQNQTGQTIRSVLQSHTALPSTTTTAVTSGGGGGIGGWNGATSSSWGSSGAGPGGAKYQSSSRFYNGYTGSGRAITQANSTAADGDDSEELKSNRPSRQPTKGTTKQKARSRSQSLSGRLERGEKLGVLQTVKLHARSRHAFAETSGTGDGKVESEIEGERVPRRRRNSTASHESSSNPASGIPPPPPEALQKQSTAPQSSRIGALPWKGSEDEFIGDDKALSVSLQAAKQSGDPTRVIHEVSKIRAAPGDRTTTLFNLAIEALYETRTAGEPLKFILETYNDMIGRSLIPNFKTYSLLILALTDRDEEVRKVITTLQTRKKTGSLPGRSEVSSESMDNSRIKQLQSENNFASAMSLFQAACSVPYFADKIPIQIYSNLIRSCANHANLDAAISVYGHLEQRQDVLPSPMVYANLISAFTNAKDLKGAKTVFAEFKAASREDRIGWRNRDLVYGDSIASLGDDKRSGAARTSQLIVYNRMLEAYFRCGQPAAALGLLEKMMDTEHGDAFGPADAPPPASSTFTVVISGFCQVGDVTTALSWFDKLLQQERTARHPWEPSAQPVRPDQVAWICMLEALMEHQMVDELNKLWSIQLETATRDGLQIRPIDRIGVLELNIRRLNSNADMPQDQVIATLDFLAQQVFFTDARGGQLNYLKDQTIRLADAVVQKYALHNSLEKAVDFVEHYMACTFKQCERGLDAEGNTRSDYQVKSRMQLIISNANAQLLTPTTPPLPLPLAFRISRLSESVGLLPSRSTASYYLYAFQHATKAGDSLNLTLREWEILTYAATVLALPPVEGEVVSRPKDLNWHGIASFLKVLERHNVEVGNMSDLVLRRLVQISLAHAGRPDSRKAFASLGHVLGPMMSEVLSSSDGSLSDTAVTTPVSEVDLAPLPMTKRVTIDPYHSRSVEEFFPSHPRVTPLTAYARFQKGMHSGMYPTPEVIGRLIAALGRLGELDKVRILYGAAQTVLNSLEHDKKLQSQGWYQVEDQMIVAYAHAGRADIAHTHRVRMLEHGGTPSADAYGALIQCVKDTTDDTQNAMALFEESQVRGVNPNTFLYNTIISKLAKARKADYAIELFQQMKITGHRPTSVTYGAVIAACCRVGDAHSADQLFIEMTSQGNFRPRVPPYNTMIQLYVHTKPDRERALHYYNALLDARIQPSAHTYKLLLDAYGTIEPVDIQAMEQVFAQLTTDKNVTVNGTHWAALINATGCVQKDLDKAVAIFESVATHPSTLASRSVLPDAIVYESLINVFVTLRRPDLIPPYIERLRASGIHMTAYIANLLIKGYAASGDLEQARSVFEGLLDPPEGIAAPNNHLSHGSGSSGSVPTNAPVYREPSTWEAMVRAELGNGERDRAVALLDRLQARKFPPAVYNRISGIMLDDSVSPWPSTDSSTVASSELP
ncbi:hypothetical protein JAAARDRAFT_53039 [Jaapia argillacea MUCL 33604]|uniref:Uncharacterized protein n=1 Tax=Jaapia argillacea MUCL 33604 TaxID=933084 RepID=A0A067QNJ7_9AGAM|nr:hypothetical protein JAAARDRAFT_53039 [Jaapia argillacea MUCL 33604]